jgi:hypothetical protein
VLIFDSAMSEISEEKRKELIEKIRKQVALEEKAFRIVEKLVDHTPSEESLVADLQFITFDQYSDIVEERSITQLCGYPLCANSLSDVPKKKYQISVKNKTVYDISERKKFCSNKCYKASTYLQKQIPTSPIWLRENERPATINFIPQELNKGCVGEVVVTRRKTELQEELEALAKLDALTLRHEPEVVPTGGNDSRSDSGLPSADDIDSESSNQETVVDNCETNAAVSQESTASAECFRVPSKKISPSAPVQQCKTHMVTEILASMQKRKGQFRNCAVDIASESNIPPLGDNSSGKKSKADVATNNGVGVVKTVATAVVKENAKLCSAVSLSPSGGLLNEIKSTLMAWKTPKTVALITAGKQVDASHSSNSRHQDLFCGRMSDARLQAYDRLFDDDDVRAGTNLPTRKLPDTGRLAKDDKYFELKVKEFYGQKIGVKFGETQGQDAGEEDKEVVLPFVDSHSRTAIRRKIVLDKLSSVLGDVVEHTPLRMRDISTAVRDLVHTFELTSKNILLKSAAWVIVGYILLKLIAVRNEAVCNALHCETLVAFVRPLLAASLVTDADIGEIVHWMATVDCTSGNRLETSCRHLDGSLTVTTDEVVD